MCYMMNELKNEYELFKAEFRHEFIRQKKEELEMINHMKYINGTIHSNFLLGFIFFMILCFVLIRLIG